jgi:hypothetical protein
VNANNNALIERLKMEILIIERGGYQPSVREPRVEPRFFRDSVSCLNFALKEKQDPCSECFLMEFVPPERRNEEEPCHYIPLNAEGDTLASLTERGERERAQQLLLDWLYNTITRLRAEMSPESKTN